MAAMLESLLVTRVPRITGTGLAWRRTVPLPPADEQPGLTDTRPLTRRPVPMRTG